MDSAESISRGCFAFKAKGKRKIAKPEDYFPKDKDSRDVSLQYDVYQEVWEDIDSDIQMLQADLNCEMFYNLLAFIRDSRDRVKRQGSVREIPAAALITGVNTPDHAVMFANLASMLKSRVTPLVATVRSKDCPTVKTLISKFLAQLLSMPEMELPDEIEENTTRLSTQVCSMMTLVKHYEAFCQTSASPSKGSPSKGSPRKSPKKLRLSKPQKPIAVIFEDIENFSANVLQDFIVTCSNYLDRLPVVLVLGIATSITTIHRQLPASVSSLLCMEKFQVPPSTLYLTLLIDKILIGKVPFKLGPTVFQLLLDNFLCHHLSVLNFITAFQYCMLQHYTTTPMSMLCCKAKDIPEMVEQLTANNVQHLQQLPSVMRYMDHLPPKELAVVLKSDDNFKGMICSLLKENTTVQSRIYATLLLLHALTAHLPTHPLGKQTRELYALCLEKDIQDTEGFSKALELLGMTSRDELKRLIGECTNHMKDAKDSALKEICETMSRYIYRLEHLEEEQLEVLDVRQEEEELKLQKMDLRSLQKRLQEMGKKKKMSPYEKVRLEFLDYLKETVRKYLLKSESVPLYEVLYYDDAAVVRRNLYAAPRSAIHQALSDPAHYLQCSCCLVEEGGISPTMPDICIAYKLHLESGQLINLYDWLQAFACVVSAEELENSKKSHQPDKVIQARFIQAVSELQFLGFVKPTKRKTDHVARLTWGGC